MPDINTGIADILTAQNDAYAVAGTPSLSAPLTAASGGSKSLSALLSFVITGSGTVKGAFLVLGSGGVSTIDDTAGTLFSAGLFSEGDKIVGSGDTVNVSYSVSV